MTGRIKGVVVGIEGSKIIIETHTDKHWKLKHGRSNLMEYDYLYKSGAPKAKNPRPWYPEDMPTKDTLVRVIFRKAV